MAKTKAPDPKVDALQQQASLNPHPQRVSDPLFAATDFFDPRDLVQVKYEMVRRVRVDGQSVATARKRSASRVRRSTRRRRPSNAGGSRLWSPRSAARAARTS